MEVNFKRDMYGEAVFLDGIGDSDWRKKLIAMLDEDVPYFNPQNTDWSDIDFDRQEKCRKVAKIKVWCITSADIYTGWRIYEELSKMEDPKSFILCAVGKYEDPAEKNAVEMVKRKAELKKAIVCKSLKDVANEINAIYAKEKAKIEKADKATNKTDKTDKQE